MGDEPPKEYFCYLSVQNTAEFVIYLVEIGLSVCLAVYAIRKYLSMRSARNKQTAFVYLLLFLWWISKCGLS